jgi:hypothetical protein
MIVMTPMFILFCVVVPQQMNGLPCLSKIPYLKVKQNPVSPFKHRGLIRTFCCALCSYLSCEVSIMLHGCISRRRNTLWTEWQPKRDKPASSSVIAILICTGFHFSNLYWLIYVSWFVHVLYLSIPWFSAGKRSLVVYFHGKLQIQFAGWWKLLAIRR